MVAAERSLPIQVVIIAADPVLRADLGERLRPYDDIALVGTTDDVTDGRILVERLGPAVLLVDGDLPDQAGLPLAQELNERTPSIVSIVLTRRVGSKGMLFAALSHWAAGFAGAAVDGHTLGDLVRRVACGERPIDDIFLRGAHIPGAPVKMRRTVTRSHIARPTRDVDSGVVAGATDFAFALFGALRETAANLFISPYSVMQTLAMAYAGACDRTADQMAAIIGCNLPQPELHAALGDLQADVLARGNGEDDVVPHQPAPGLSIANALWVEQTFPFSPAYSALLERSYGAGLRTTDFAGAPDTAPRQINDWVAEQTADRIRDIVPPGGIDDRTRLVLANAIWFADDWADPFDVFYTRDDEFFLLDGETVAVPFMAREDRIPYMRGDGYQAIELAYAGSGFALTAILPDADHFDLVDANLSAATFSALIEQLAPTRVRLAIPKFEFDADLSLTCALQAMGMHDAFDPIRADFREMLDGAPPEPLWIGDVIHKAYIRVDEQGSEAAAATVLRWLGFSDQSPELEPIEVCIDRPFLFAIRDTETGAVLFLGRVLNPRA